MRKFTCDYTLLLKTNDFFGHLEDTPAGFVNIHIIGAFDESSRVVHRDSFVAVRARCRRGGRRVLSREILREEINKSIAGEEK